MKIFRIIQATIVISSYFVLYCYYKFYLQKREFLCQKNGEYLSTKPHIAIVIADKHSSDYSLIADAFNLHNKLIYSDDINKLKEHFLTLKMPFKVYKSISPKAFKRIVFDKKIHSLFIFGHGSKTSLAFGRFPTKFVDYSEFRNAPKKRFIAQYHCNSGKRPFIDYYNYLFGKFYKINYDRGTSLKKLLGARGYDEDGFLTAKEINKHIAKICKGYMKI